MEKIYGSLCQRTEMTFNEISTGQMKIKLFNYHFNVFLFISMERLDGERAGVWPNPSPLLLAMRDSVRKYRPTLLEKHTISISWNSEYSFNKMHICWWCIYICTKTIYCISIQCRVQSSLGYKGVLKEHPWEDQVLLPTETPSTLGALVKAICKSPQRYMNVK